MCHTCTVACVGVPPPLNVQASQASPSDPVEVSWSPPSDGTTTITGYRIFYGNGENISLPSNVNSIGLATRHANVSYIGQRVTVCSEVELLDNQCVTTVVTGMYSIY